MKRNFDQARVVSIDKNKGRVTLFTKNGLVSVGTYLHDINDLREGMSVLIGDVDGTKVILNKIADSPKNSSSVSLVRPYYGQPLADFRIDTYYSPNNVVTLPLLPGGTYDFYVDWGDDSLVDHVTSYSDPGKTHAYFPPGPSQYPNQYNVNISGILKGWSTDRPYPYSEYLIIGASLDHFDFDNNDYGRQFYRSVNLNSIGGTDKVPNLSTTTSLRECFFYCTLLRYIWFIENWDVSNVTNMKGMFGSCSFFNQSLNNWDVSHVTDMDYMFSDDLIFNQPLNNWDVSNVITMSEMFRAARAFNQPLNNWNVSNVTNMHAMFEGTTFNQPLNNWDVSNVTNMRFMFYGSSFNQDISMWNITKVTNMEYMFTYSAFSTVNYEKLLVSWSAQNVKNGVLFDAGYAQYHEEYASFKQILIDKGWTIRDGGLYDGSGGGGGVPK
jgi:surface protein